MNRTEMGFLYLSAIITGMFTTVALAGAPSSTTFTYQGQLKLSGDPLTGTTDFEFTLWDSEIGGTQVGSPVSRDAAEVKNGLFQVPLDFGANALGGGTKWLAISVRNPAGGGSFVPVLPRQQITSSLYSIQTRGIFVADNNNVGIGTTNPTSLLHVVGDTGVNHAVYRHTTETVSGAAGVYGESNSTSGYGVFGFGSSSSGLNYGVYGQTYSNNGRGVYGRASRSDGTTYGVVGQSQSNHGTGVYGMATSTSGTTYAVRGDCESPTGFAGYFAGRGHFRDAVGFGVIDPYYPVQAFSNDSTAIHASSNLGQAIYGYSRDGTGISGDCGSPDGYAGYFNGRGYFGGNVGIRAALEVAGDGTFRSRLGIGNPPALGGQLTIVDSGDGSIHAIEATSNTTVFPTIFARNTAKEGSVLWAIGDSDASPSGGGLIVAGDQAAANIAIDGDEIMARDAGQPSTLHLNAEGGQINMGEHNIHPAFAYGKVDQTGTPIAVFSNVTAVIRVSEGDYEIHVSGGAQSTDIIIVSINDRVVVMGARPEGGNYRAYAFGNNTGDPLDTDFSFVIYRP